MKSFKEENESGFRDLRNILIALDVTNISQIIEKYANEKLLILATNKLREAKYDYSTKHYLNDDILDELEVT